MEPLCLLGYVGILLFIGCFAFTVLAIPLFYTAITRWAFSGGNPVARPADIDPTIGKVAAEAPDKSGGPGEKDG